MVKPSSSIGKNKRTALCELRENDKCRVPNNLTEVRVVNSKDCVMSSEKENLEDQ